MLPINELGHIHGKLILKKLDLEVRKNRLSVQ